LVYPAE